jgi:hypothetical protein
MSPRIYLAGKIGKNDWRHGLVPGLRGHLWGDGPIKTKSFDYVGPFFVGSNHGGNHGPNRHGAVGDDSSFDQNFDQQAVIDNNTQALAKADLVFAYITAIDCYGTLIEIGGTLAMGIRVVIAFAPGMPSNEFWYSAKQAASTHVMVRPCCLPQLLLAEIGKIQSFHRSVRS